MLEDKCKGENHGRPLRTGVCNLNGRVLSDDELRLD